MVASLKVLSQVISDSRSVSVHFRLEGAVCALQHSKSLFLLQDLLRITIELISRARDKEQNRYKRDREP